MDLARKEQVVNRQTSPVSVFKLRHCGLEMFSERLGLVSVLYLTSCGHPWCEDSIDIEVMTDVQVTGTTKI